MFHIKRTVIPDNGNKTLVQGGLLQQELNYETYEQNQWGDTDLPIILCAILPNRIK